MYTSVENQQVLHKRAEKKYEEVSQKNLKNKTMWNNNECDRTGKK